MKEVNIKLFSMFTLPSFFPFFLGGFYLQADQRNKCTVMYYLIAMLKITNKQVKSVNTHPD